ncbi:transcriptional regulator [Aliidongia dinghuensis]|uniref:Transcriptional regulator n=1 Tax=Aliidongia dinghuensis TaxID=1867774 RepID=A0A8J2YRG8_9PROT|nr:helix-turn-helix transcriptional regulator [Aliidongia dinghuensis]GGF09504.1 transcriptional regulator [Aliidongia dinghuensis]
MTYSTDPNDYQRVPVKVAAMAKDFPPGHVVGEHVHERAQLVYAVSGVMRVTTRDGTWVVPTHRAVWVPPGEPHQIRMSGAVAMRTLYIAKDATASLPSRCGVIEVGPLLRELILAATDHPPDQPDPTGRMALIGALVLVELRSVPVMPLHAPLPRDPRLVAVCRALIDDPARPEGLEAWADRVGASARTLARLFRAETGMSFAAWRQQTRLIEALARLAEGQSVSLVARDLGYDSASAFTAMFRRTLGSTPSRYFERLE